MYAAGRGRAPSLAAIIPRNEDLAAAARSFKQVVDQGIVLPADPAWLVATSQAESGDLDLIWNDQGYLIRRPDTLMRIDPRGRVYVSIKLKPNMDDQIYIGNALKDDVPDLWRSSPILTQLRQRYKYHRYFGPVVDVRHTAELREGCDA
jgi:hypothetical protein